MSKLSRAFDAVRLAAPLPARRAIFTLPARPQRRALSVVKALEWAFATEQVSIEFDEVNPDAYTVGCDPIWRMMRQAELGCRVQGGGTSPRADDAEVIASIVARLPAGVGGKGMALQIAHHARACSAPDPMLDTRLRLVVCDGWKTTKHGEFAQTRVFEEEEVIYRGRKVKFPRVGCAIDFRPKPHEISRARRAWLDWWGALLHLRHELSSCGLARIEITADMPPMTPWIKAC